MPVEMTPYTMPICDVAEVLEVCTNRVRQMDGVLKPQRKRNGTRRYDPAVVADVLRRRAEDR